MQAWLGKQQRRLKQVSQLQKLMKRNADYELDVKMSAFEQLKQFASNLKQIQERIEGRKQIVLRAKAFYFWINKWHMRHDHYLNAYHTQLKRRSVRCLKAARANTQARASKVDCYFNKKLVLKAFFGMLKFLETCREEKVQTQQTEEKTLLGLVHVVPVVDKNVDDAYSNMHHMRSLPNLPDFIKDGSVENLHESLEKPNPVQSLEQDFGQNLNLTFKNGFSFTGALLSARKRAIQGS